MPEPKYMRLAAAIREQIQSGALKPGDKLLSTAALKAQYGIGNETVRWAMAELVREGLIVTGQGEGRWVSPGPSDPFTEPRPDPD